MLYGPSRGFADRDTRQSRECHTEYCEPDENAAHLTLDTIAPWHRLLAQAYARSADDLGDTISIAREVDAVAGRSCRRDGAAHRPRHLSR